MSINLAPSVLMTLDAILDETRNDALENFIKRLVPFSVNHGLNRISPSDQP